MALHSPSAYAHGNVKWHAASGGPTARGGGRSCTVTFSDAHPELNGVEVADLEQALETEIANLIVWPSLFEQQRRLVLSSRMIGFAERCSARAKWFKFFGDFLQTPGSGRCFDQAVWI